MISRRLVPIVVLIAFVVTALALETVATIHLTQVNNLGRIQAASGQLLQVRLDYDVQDVISTNPAVVEPVPALAGGSKPQYFVAALPGVAILTDRSHLGQRCLALLCDWQIEVDVT